MTVVVGAGDGAGAGAGAVADGDISGGADAWDPDDVFAVATELVSDDPGFSCAWLCCVALIAHSSFGLFLWQQDGDLCPGFPQQ